MVAIRAISRVRDADDALEQGGVVAVASDPDVGVDVGLLTAWGIDEDGFPYVSDDSAAEGEEAALAFDPVSGEIIVISANERTGLVAATTADIAAAIADEVAARTRGLSAEADARIAADLLKIPLTQRGAANGVATLGADGLVPSAQLPASLISTVFASTVSYNGDGNEHVPISLLIPGGTPTVGQMYRLEGTFTVSNSTGISQNLSVRVRLGALTGSPTLSGTQLLNVSFAVGNAVSGRAYRVSSLLSVRAIGNASTGLYYGDLAAVGASAPGTGGNSANVDTTIDENLGLTFAWPSVGTPSQLDVTVQQLRIRREV